MTSGSPNKIVVTDFTLTTALGRGRDAHREALFSENGGLRRIEEIGVDDLDTWVGVVDGVEDEEIPASLSDYRCRNNQLATLALRQDDFNASIEHARAEYGADRIGLFLGTSTSGIRETELAYEQMHEGVLPEWYNYYATHNVYSLVDFVKNLLGLAGYSIAISTACSSSAKVFASAQRAIDAGFCDAAIVGGVDTLCSTTLYGFNSLQLLSTEPCRPFDANRSGISIGEAGGFALVERKSDPGIRLLGYGETSDAHHMSSPHPEGEGARLAMDKALSAARLAPEAVDYWNLHGTGTPANDAAEARAVAAFCTGDVPASSTKGFTGHTLGAAGIVEAAIVMMALEDDCIPPNLNHETLDPDMGIRPVRSTRKANVRHGLTNSFGFGGSNCTLVFGKEW